MTDDVVWHDTKITREDRVSRLGYSNKVVWLTGLSGSGKSTIADELSSELHKRGFLTYVLDGDNVRHGLNSDLGFSAEDRKENIRRVAELSKLFYDAGIFVIVSFISPYSEDRDYARSLVGEDFVEVFVDSPVDICESRDPKGLYGKAREGKIKGFTGIDSPYEVPENPEIVLDTSDLDIGECVVRLMDGLEIDLELAKKAAERAGKAIMEIYAGDDYSVESKDDHSPVTMADKEAEKLIKKRLFTTGYPILSEESEDDISRIDSRRIWVVDPLDGTKEFITGNGEFTVNIALVEDGVPILGVVYAPAVNEMYHAQKGKGAFFNGKRVMVSDTTAASDMILMKSRSHADARLADIEKRFYGSVSRGSSLKGCNVASGDADVYMRFGNVHEWDICAMHSVIEEAGGKMTYMDGSEIVYNRKNTLLEGGFIASNGKAHNDILGLLDNLK